ncbi:hypothetical protein HL657_06525 [Methanoculleus sp. YWC-01]|uniref:Uncharacterized protein n=1 Tax=Methanoculleus nereidis TaxID=2735141 RepID=A0ABU3Z1Y2_9EURY|nr:hypothetical protein [Methanoculleus sp. YWC-01]MDV4342832.1 hypothetical protein [Methanoculleus sp. YWC-01]
MCESLRETGAGSPTPMAIAVTVHGMRRCPRKKVAPGIAGSGTGLSRIGRPE